MSNIFVRSWKGEASLAAAFWLVNVLFSIILEIILAMVLVYLMGAGSTKVNAVVITILFPYTIYGAICVWRCGKNSTPVWSIISKIVVVLGIIFSAFSIISLLTSAR